jgi:hypothetical protein
MICWEGARGAAARSEHVAFVPLLHPTHSCPHTPALGWDDPCRIRIRLLPFPIFYPFTPPPPTPGRSTQSMHINHFAGHLQLTIADIVRSGGELNGTLPLTASNNGSVELKIHFQSVSPVRYGARFLAIRGCTRGILPITYCWRYWIARLLELKPGHACDPTNTLLGWSLFFLLPLTLVSNRKSCHPHCTLALHTEGILNRDTLCVQTPTQWMRAQPHRTGCHLPRCGPCWWKRRRRLACRGRRRCSARPGCLLHHAGNAAR